MNPSSRHSIACGLALLAIFGCTHAAPSWRENEKSILAHQTQLTFPDRFVKAGESYFSPDDSRVIFQAVEVPPQGEPADEFYALFVADVKRDAASGRIIALENYKRLSPKGSANTCGWFHPTQNDVVIFASTINQPTQSEAPGYQRGTGRYKWMFPPEMRIVQCNLNTADGTAASLKTIVGDGKAYCAEGSFDRTGRHLLYCSLESNEGDLFVHDTKTGATNRIVQARGYDGGPFFSPDGKRICYRSDRRGDHYLQLFVADLAFNERGEIVGIQREFQLTDDGAVNWAPFWTADGRRLVYASSTVSHSNYEVFMIDADPGDLPGSSGTIRYGIAKRRLTHADGADVLPAFAHDGKTMIWTSQRAGHAPARDDANRGGGESQLWVAQFVLNPDVVATPADVRPPQREPEQSITIEDPDTGRIFVYNLATHALSEYNPRTHQLVELTNQADIDRFMELRARQQRKEKTSP